MKTRTAVGILSGLAGTAAAAVGAVSLTRIAGQYLGFPHGLEWTLTAATDIGAIAGAVLWSTAAPDSSFRRTGVRMNVACSSVSAIAVGLDHAANADGEMGWRIAAFLIGAFLPLLSTWLVHGLARLTHGETKGRTRTDRPVKATAKPVVATKVVAPPPVPAPSVPPALSTAPPPAAPRGPRRDSPAVVWARENWPCGGSDIEQATGVSRATAYRAVATVKAEQEERHVTAVA